MMLISIWDFFFTRKTWTIIETYKVNTNFGVQGGIYYVLQDQFGNVKTKRVTDG